MNELQAILASHKDAVRHGKRTVLATVVKVSGSAYRRPGARMLIKEDGSTTGTVSGGCLESDVAMKALSMLSSGTGTLLVEYDTTREDELIFGVGLGCGGSTFIFLEVVGPQSAVNAISLLSEGSRTNEPSVLATLVDTQSKEDSAVGTHLIVRSGHEPVGTIRDGALRSLILADAMGVLKSRRATASTYMLSNDKVEVFLDFVDPPISLLIFGAGHDAQPMASLAKELGWTVTIVDDRPKYATRERFPQCDHLICCRADDLPAHLDLKPHSAAVVMTHNFLRDARILEALLKSPVRYIGVLGPKLRTKRLIQQLEESGLPLSSEQLQRICAPVGLDIGAETPGEIALAVLAEIQAMRTGRSGGLLRDRKGPIHDESSTERSQDLTALKAEHVSAVTICRT